MAGTIPSTEDFKLAIQVGALLVPVIVALVVFIHNLSMNSALGKLKDVKESHETNIEDLYDKTNKNTVQIALLKGETKGIQKVCVEKHKEKEE